MNFIDTQINLSLQSKTCGLSAVSDERKPIQKRSSSVAFRYSMIATVLTALVVIGILSYFYFEYMCTFLFL